MDKVIGAVFITLFFSWHANAQNVISWQRSLGGASYDAVSSILPVADGGYILAGSTLSSDGNVSFNHGKYTADAWLVKLKSDGATDWQKTYGGSLSDHALSMIITSDGGYVVAGYTTSNDGDISNNHGGKDVWVFRVNSSGALQWEKTYGGTNDDEAHSIIATSDGGYIVAGFSASGNGTANNNNGKKDFWVIKLTADGTLDWQKNYGGSDDEEANVIRASNDGGYIIAGFTRSTDGDVSNNHGYYDYWVVKIKGDGALQWSKTYGGGPSDKAYAILPLADGNYIVAGESYSKGGDIKTVRRDTSDAWLIKIQGDGTLIWEKLFGGRGTNSANALVPTPDGYLVACTSDSKDEDIAYNHGNDDIWLIKFRNDTIFEWQRSLGGSANEFAESITATADGNFVLAGESYSQNGDVDSNHGSSDVWAMKLSYAAMGIQSQDITGGVSVFPNPASNGLNINFSEGLNEGRLTIVDMQGRTLSASFCNSSQLEMDVTGLQPGMYFLRFTGKNKTWALKFCRW